MIITVEYLEERHRFWMARIAEAGIWNADNFDEVKLEVRPHSKTCRGKFYSTSRASKGFVEKIVIYQQYPDITVREIDDTLVHEMIHQYIRQSMLRDTSTHGKLFRRFMKQINKAFPEELEIGISYKVTPRKGEGLTMHKLLLLESSKGYCFCCKLMPSKVDEFLAQAERLKGSGTIRSYALCESRDQYFDEQRACRTRLHGLRLTLPRLQALCEECNIRKVRII